MNKEVKQAEKPVEPEKLPEAAAYQAANPVKEVGANQDVKDVLQLLLSKITALEGEIADLRKPPVFGGTPAGAPARADGINPGFDKNKGYVKKSRGYPVQPGQTWHDLSPEQRNQWFREHENRWKQKYSEKANQLGQGGQMSWTRG